MRALGVAWPVFARTIKRVAHKITKDPDQRDDLIQSAMVELWEIDPTRFVFRDAKEVGYVREILVNRMLRVWGVDQGGDQRLSFEPLIPIRCVRDPPQLEGNGRRSPRSINAWK